MLILIRAPQDGSIETLLKTDRMNLGLNILLIFMVSSSSNPSNLINYSQVSRQYPRAL